MQMTFKDFANRLQTFAVYQTGFVQSTAVIINMDDSTDMLIASIGVETNRGNTVYVPVRAVGDEIFIIIDEDQDIKVNLDLNGLHLFLWNHFEHELVEHKANHKK